MDDGGSAQDMGSVMKGGDSFLGSGRGGSPNQLRRDGVVRSWFCLCGPQERWASRFFLAGKNERTRARWSPEMRRDGEGEEEDQDLWEVLVMEMQDLRGRELGALGQESGGVWR